MKKNNILLLPGDGVGPEIMSEAIKILDFFNSIKTIDLNYKYSDIGGIAIDNSGSPLTKETLEKAEKADCVLLGAVGVKKYENNDQKLKPEYGLLLLRKSLNLYANIRPIFLFDTLVNSSSLKPEIIKDLDIVIIRELIGDVYFGEPRGFNNNSDGKEAFNTMKYSENEISRIAKFAFNVAMKRLKKVTSVDKANVLETSQLWREVVAAIGQKHFPEVNITNMYVDNAAMQLIKEPKQFDVILTSNLFGDILSDEASMLTGSIGMLPSASLSDSSGLYEPVHGSAPDIAGMSIVNPIAMILSCAMMFEYSLNRADLAEIITSSVRNVLKSGIATKDLTDDNNYASTSQMGNKILEDIKKSV
jgi:3-isopropylmalate dehydrogenase